MTSANSTHNLAPPEESLSNKFQEFGASGNWMQAVGLLAVFAVALLACCAYNLWSVHSKNILVADSINYLHSSGYVANFLLSLLQGHPDCAIFTDQKQIGAIMLDGPIITSIYGSIFAALGHIPGHQDWIPLVIGHSLFHAASACLVATIAFQLLNNRALSVLAGVVWGLYPGAIIASGRFMTETLGAFFILLAVSFLLRASKQKTGRAVSSWFLASGIWLGLTILLRLALAPALALSCLVAALQSPRKRLAAIMLPVGVLVALCPWAIYTKIATGVPHFITGRGPMFALYGVGWDTEADAWWTIPNSPLNGLYTARDGMDAAEIAEWRRQPLECAALTVTKLKRLYAQPWNDYYQKCLGLGPSQQTFLHQALLLLALWAGCAFAISGFSLVPPKARLASQICTIMLGVTLPYILFECHSRYGFCSFPFVAILGVAGGWLLYRALKRQIPDIGRFALSGIIAAMVFLIIVNGEAFCNCKYPVETAHKIKPGNWITKTIDLSGAKLPNSSAVLLLVDGDKGLETARIAINGHSCAVPLISLNHFDPVRYGLYDLMRLLQPADTSVKDFRQWRALSFPREWLKPDALNSVTISAGTGPATIYGDSIDSEKMVSPDGFAPQKLGNELMSFEMRVHSPIPAHRVKQSSTISGTNVPPRVLPDSLRVKFGIPVNLAAPAASGGESQFRYTFAGKDFDIFMRDDDGSLSINRWILRAAQRTGADVALPSFRASSHLAVSIEGDVRAESSGEAGVLVALADAQGEQVALGELPTHMKASPQWTHFKYDELIPSGVLHGKPSKLNVSLYPCNRDEVQYGVGKQSVDATFKDITVEVKALDYLNVAGARIIYY